MDSTLYIANGSKYQVKLCDLHVRKPQSQESHVEPLPNIDNHAEAVTTANNRRESTQSVVIGIGEVLEVPPSFRYLTIFLRDKENKPVLENWKASENKIKSGDKMSIIVTEEGSVQFGGSDKPDPKKGSVQFGCSDNPDLNWVWISRTDGTDHRPRQRYIANASGTVITVRRRTGNGERVGLSIRPRETAFVEYEDIGITVGGKSFEVKRAKPRTSIVVFSDNYKVTGQLHGENIEEEKWKVDGENYKPYTYWEIATMPVRSVSSAAWFIIIHCSDFCNGILTLVKDCLRCKMTAGR